MPGPTTVAVLPIAKGASYDRAIADYDKAIEIDPKYAQAYNNRGYAYEAKGEHDRAIADYDKAIEIDPEVRVGLHQPRYVYAAKGEHDRAIADYDKAIEIDPKHALAYTNRGYAYAAKGEHDRAIADYDKAIEIDPTQAYAYSGRVHAREAKGDYNARTDHNRAIENRQRPQELLPTTTKLDPFNKQIESLFDQGKYADALGQQRALVADIKKSEIISTGNPGRRTAEGLGRLAWFAHLTRDFDEALAVTERALALAPDLLWIELNRAHALLFIGRLDEAQALYVAHTGKQTSKDDDRIWEDVIADDFEVLRTAGLDHAAFAEIITALGLNSAETGLRKQVTQLYQAGKYTEAVPLAERYVGLARQRYGEEHAGFATAIAWLGILYDAQGHYAEAEPLYKRALAIREKAQGSDHPMSARRSTISPGYTATRAVMPRPSRSIKRALAISEKALGPDHPDVGIITQQPGRAVSTTKAATPRPSRSTSARSRSARRRSAPTIPPSEPRSTTWLGSIATRAAMPRPSRSSSGRSPSARRRWVPTTPMSAGRSTTWLRCITTRAATPRPSRSTSARSRSARRRWVPTIPMSATSLNNLAAAVSRPGPLRRGRAAVTSARSRSSRRRWVPTTPMSARRSTTWPSLYRRQGRYAEAEPLFKRSAGASREKALGPDHPDVGIVAEQPGRAVSRPRAATPRPSRCTSARSPSIEKALGPDHPNVGTSLNNLAALYFVQRDWARAADYWRRSTGVIVRRARRGTDDVGQALTGKRKGEAEQSSYQFWGLVKTVLPPRIGRARCRRKLSPRDVPDGAMGISLGSRAVAGADGGSHGHGRSERSAAWFETGRTWSGNGRSVIRRAVLRCRKPRTSGITPPRRPTWPGLLPSTCRLPRSTNSWRSDFPDYAALVNPGAVSVEDIQAQLGADEALLLFLDTPEWKPTPEESFLWVVTKSDMRWVRVELGTKALTERVAALALWARRGRMEMARARCAVRSS